MRNDVKIVLFSQFFSCHLKETKKGAQERGYMMCFWVLATVKITSFYNCKLYNKKSYLHL